MSSFGKRRVVTNIEVARLEIEGVYLVLVSHLNKWFYLFITEHGPDSASCQSDYQRRNCHCSYREYQVLSRNASLSVTWQQTASVKVRIKYSFGFTCMQARSVDQFNPEMKLLLRFGFKPLTSVTDRWDELYYVTPPGHGIYSLLQS